MKSKNRVYPEPLNVPIAKSTSFHLKVLNKLESKKHGNPLFLSFRTTFQLREKRVTIVRKNALFFLKFRNCHLSWCEIEKLGVSRALQRTNFREQRLSQFLRILAFFCESYRGFSNLRRTLI